MPEIEVMLFDLTHLFKLFPKENKEISQKIEKFEHEIQENMAENRLKLFSEFGYNDEFEKALTW